MMIKQYKSIQLWDVDGLYIILNHGVYDKYKSKQEALDHYTNLVHTIYGPHTTA